MHFRSPHDIFEEFFGTKNIFDLFDDDSMFTDHPAFRGAQSSSQGNTSRQQQRQSQRSINPHSQMMQQIFGFNDHFSMMGGMMGGGGGGGMSGGFTSFSSISNGTGGGGSRPGVVKSTSRSTKVVNGKKFVTVKTVENGVETVTVEEDGVVKSKTVNGVAQAIEFRK